MNCIKEAESKLRKYKRKKNALKSLPEQIANLEEQMICVRSAAADGTAVHGGGSGRENALLDNIAERAELQKALDDTKKWVNAVSGALDALTSEERRILELFYIEKQKHCVERLSEEMHMSTASVYRRRDDAIRSFTYCYYGVLET